MSTASMALPTVTVIIPTYNRLPVLRRCLDALGGQRYPTSRMEVIVVADGCSDGTAATLRATRQPFDLTVLEQENAGAAAARNRGAQAARGELLLFLDDDVIASPNLVAAHAAAHAGSGERAVVGPYPLDPPSRTDYMAQALHGFWARTFREMADPAHRPSFGDLLTGNLSIRGTTFARLGGFDPAFPGCGIEDYEFGVRVLQSGIPIVFQPRAEARHLETTDLRSSLARNRSGGGSALILAELHPHVLPTTRLPERSPWAHRLVFRTPRLGALLAECAYHGLRVAQALRLRRLWIAVYGRLRTYWFWRGVRDRVETEEEWNVRLDRLVRERRSHSATEVSLGRTR
jgi:GT2 family glycosyltransferase